MNLYECISTLETYARQHTNTLFYRQFNIQKAEKIQRLVARLKHLEQHFAYSGLDALYPDHLSAHKFEYENKLLRCFDLVQSIQSDLLQVQNDNQFTWYERMTVFNPTLNAVNKMHLNLRNFKDYWRGYLYRDRAILANYYQHIQFLMNQNMLPSFGKSYGECGGIAVDYARYRKHHRGTRPPFRFTATASTLQNHQDSPHPIPEMSLKFLDSLHYQPNLREQARALALQAQDHPGEALGVVLFQLPRGGHFTYLEYTSEGNWHYFDSNYGAFEFSNREEFAQFYTQLYASLDRWIAYQTLLITEDQRPPTYWERCQYQFGRFQLLLFYELIYITLVLITCALTYWLVWPALSVSLCVTMQLAVFFAILGVFIAITYYIMAASRTPASEVVADTAGLQAVQALENNLPGLYLPPDRVVSSVSMFSSSIPNSPPPDVPGPSYQPIWA